MRFAGTDLALLAAASLISVYAVHSVRAVVAVGVSQTPPAFEMRTLRKANTDSLRGFNTKAIAAAMAGSDVFRLANTPASARYSRAAELHMSGAPLAAAVARPRLTLKAIVGGPPWQAIVDGVPGMQTAIVTAGQSIGALAIRTISRDTVTISGLDTTWKLTLRTPQP